MGASARRGRRGDRESGRERRVTADQSNPHAARRRPKKSAAFKPLPTATLRFQHTRQGATSPKINTHLAPSATNSPNQMPLPTRSSLLAPLRRSINSPPCQPPITSRRKVYVAEIRGANVRVFPTVAAGSPTPCFRRNFMKNTVDAQIVSTIQIDECQVFPDIANRSFFRRRWQKSDQKTA